MFIEDYGWSIEISIGEDDPTSGPLENLLDKKLPISTWHFKIMRAGVLVIHCRCFTKIALQQVGSRMFSRYEKENQQQVKRELEFNHWTPSIGSGLNAVRCGALTEEMTVNQVLLRIRSYLTTDDELYFPSYVR